MAPITGYPSSKKEDRTSSEPVSVNKVDQFRDGIDSYSHLFVQVIATDAVEADSTTTLINATAHSALPGDIVSFTSGALDKIEVSVREVATNTITLNQALLAAPSASDTFNILRHKRPKVDADGAVATSGGGGDVNIAEYGGTATTLGQKASAASVPVVVASDQSALPITAQAITAITTQAIVSVAATNTQILASNTSRKGGYLKNLSDAVVYIALATTATTSFYPLYPGEVFPLVGDGYVLQTQVNGITASGSKDVWAIEF